MLGRRLRRVDAAAESPDGPRVVDEPLEGFGQGGPGRRRPPHSYGPDGVSFEGRLSLMADGPRPSPVVDSIVGSKFVTGDAPLRAP